LRNRPQLERKVVGGAREFLVYESQDRRGQRLRSKLARDFLADHEIGDNFHHLRRRGAALEQGRKVHRGHRFARVVAQPAQRRGGTQGIEDLLLRDQLVIAEIDASLAFAHMQIVVGDRFTIGDMPGEAQEFLAEARINLIGDRRHQPFDDHGIALEQQLYGFAKVPAIDNKLTVHGRLDDIAALPQREIVIPRPDKDEAAVIVAVG